MKPEKINEAIAHRCTGRQDTKSRYSGMLTNRCKQVASLCTMIVLLGTFAHAGNIGEFCNYFIALPSGGGTSYTLIIQGNVTKYIDATGTAGDRVVDPFTYFEGAANSSVTVSFDQASDDTKVVFTGTNPIPPGYQFMYGGNSNGKPHFGLLPQNGGPPHFDILSQQWNVQQGNPPPAFSAISVDQSNSKGNGRYEVIFAVSADGSNQTGAWYEISYNGKFTFKNNGLDGVKLSDVGYFVTPTQIPLDNLNFADTPPPGYSGSQFTPLPQYDGQTVAPGGSIDVNAPEPSSLLLLGSGILGLAGVLRRRMIT